VKTEEHRAAGCGEEHGRRKRAGQQARRQPTGRGCSYSCGWKGRRGRTGDETAERRKGEMAGRRDGGRVSDGTAGDPRMAEYGMVGNQRTDCGRRYGRRGDAASGILRWGRRARRLWHAPA
jgi:hypothetical protein